jgi:predicted nucleotidyltransferase component of viral defense system
MASVFPPVIREQKPRWILREYLQYLILKAIYESKYGQHLVFLGGTSLRIIYGSQRFSEDIDFDNRWLSEKDWAEMGDMIVRYLQNEWLEAENQTIYKGAFHCYIRIPHVLQSYGLTPHESEKILIQIDTVAQDFSYDAIPLDIDQFWLSVRVLSTPKDILLSQKIRAAYERKRTKWRDFYDIRYLMSWWVTPNYAYLWEKMNISDNDALLSYMHEHNKTIDFASLTRDLEPFLFRSEDLRLVREFPQFVEVERNKSNE